MQYYNCLLISDMDTLYEKINTNITFPEYVLFMQASLEILHIQITNYDLEIFNTILALNKDIFGKKSHIKVFLKENLFIDNQDNYYKLIDIFFRAIRFLKENTTKNSELHVMSIYKNIFKIMNYIMSFNTVNDAFENGLILKYIVDKYASV